MSALVSLLAPSFSRPTLSPVPPPLCSPLLMRDVRAQFFLSFAVLGTVLPYAPVFFRDAGLSQSQLGLAFAAWSAMQAFTPGLVAWAADARVDPRRLVLLCSAVGGAALFSLGLVRGAGPGSVFAVWVVYCAASIPLLPLLDGIYFSLRKRREERGEGPAAAYHRVRVWGTIGYILPSVLLFWLLDAGMPVAGALMSGAAFAAAAGAQALALPDPRAPLAVAESAGGINGRPAGGGAGLPTAAAVRALLRPNLLVFCAALFMAQMASTAMAAFYPVYLTESVGVGAKWVGLIAQVGVLTEVGFVAGCGWLLGRLGTKGLLVAGLSSAAVRLGLLAASAAVPVAVGTQLFHGMQMVMMGVLPQTLLDRHADDGYRHSVQGVYVMLMGVGKTAGSLAAGWVAGYGVAGVFGYGAGACAAAAALAVVAFRETGTVTTTAAAVASPAADELTTPLPAPR